MRTEMQWLNEPSGWGARSGWLEVTTSPKSDFWFARHLKAQGSP